MKLLSIFAAFLIVCACAGDNPRAYTRVEIEQIFTDSLSIRAIAPVDTERVWFAANNGKVGLIDSLIPKLATIKYEERLLEFRAIARTSESVFVLSISNPGLLYKIAYDGKEATNIEQVYVEEHEKVFYDAMAFWNNKEGIAMGDPTDDCLSIIVTKDGGTTWTKISCDVLPNTEVGEAASAASNTNIALYGDNVWIVTGGQRARVFHSADKGSTWDVYETPIVQGKAMTGIYSVDFFDDKTGIIFGGDWGNQDFNEGNKAITKDGGKTWMLINNGMEPGYRSSVRFVPGSNGQSIVAVGSPGISISSDSGDSWMEISEEGFYAIEFVNDSIAFASGRNKIAKLIFRK